MSIEYQLYSWHNIILFLSKGLVTARYGLGLKKWAEPTGTGLETVKPRLWLNSDGKIIRIKLTLTEQEQLTYKIEWIGVWAKWHGATDIFVRQKENLMLQIQRQFLKVTDHYFSVMLWARVGRQTYPIARRVAPSVTEGIEVKDNR